MQSFQEIVEKIKAIPDNQPFKVLDLAQEVRADPSLVRKVCNHLAYDVYREGERNLYEQRSLHRFVQVAWEG